MKRLLLIILFSLAMIVTVLGIEKDYDTKVLGIQWMKVTAGKFEMGSDSGKEDELPFHMVHLDTYYISKYEVTVAQYVYFLNQTEKLYLESTEKDSHIRGNKGNYYVKKGNEKFPAGYVSWNEAMAYCEWLSKKTGKNIHLPTEAQWEKACRAGTEGERYDDVDKIAWYWENSGRKVHPVGQKLANGYGLYDMLGNVEEWCSDWYEENYYNKSPSKNPFGPSSGSVRVIRGSSYAGSKDSMRAARRLGLHPTYRWRYMGFRLARD